MNKNLNSSFQLISHRGGAALYPENTLLAFEKSILEYQCEMIELDIRTTKDGEFVIFHDPTTERTTDQNHQIEDLTLVEARKLDAAYHFTKDKGKTYPFRGKGVGIPTLKEFLDFAKEQKFSFILEVKPHSNFNVHHLKKLLDSYSLYPSMIVGSFDTATNKELLKHIPATKHFLSRGEIKILSLLYFIKLMAFYPLKNRTFHIKYTWLQRFGLGYMKAFQKLNVPVYGWTINDKQLFKYFLEEGIDGIITDRPDYRSFIDNDKTHFSGNKAS